MGHDLVVETHKKRSQSKFIVDRFTVSKDFEDFLIANPDPIITKRIKIPKNKPSLAIIVGESGIGKTTSICHYVQELRADNKPVLYHLCSKRQ